MPRTVLHFLDDIQDATENIWNYTRGISRKEFLSHKMIQDAVVRNFEVIGEAVKNLPDDLKARYPDVEWRKIAGIRDAMVHGYFRIDYEVLWEIIERDLPPLQNRIQAIITDQEKREAKQRG